MDWPVISILIAFGLLCVYTIFDYKRICKQEELGMRRELDETARFAIRPRDEDWDWPERKVGPVGRTHLGRRV